MASWGSGAFFTRFLITSLKDLGHGFHQSINSSSHLPYRVVAIRPFGISAMVASGLFLRINPTLSLPSTTTQHPHCISQIWMGGASGYLLGSKLPDKKHMNLSPCPYMRSASFMFLSSFISFLQGRVRILTARPKHGILTVVIHPQPVLDTRCGVPLLAPAARHAHL